MKLKNTFYASDIWYIDGFMECVLAQFSVIFPGAPQFTAKPASITSAKLGQDITIACRVAGMPTAKITWTYNSNPLLQNERMTFDNSIIGNNTNSDLKIKNIQESDLGYYGCNGVNENGDIYAETLLML